MPDRWQPIATAPRTGEPIDLWVPGTPEGHRHADAWWECVGDEAGWWCRPAGQREPVRVDGATHWTRVPPPRVEDKPWSVPEVRMACLISFIGGVWVCLWVCLMIWGKP
jgi:hypothetical protein